METLKAIKGNREYKVDETAAESYVKEGFDIYRGAEKIKSGKGRTVPLDEYEKLSRELEELKEASGTAPDSETVPILLKYAELKQIKTGNAATAKGILKKIKDSGG